MPIAEPINETKQTTSLAKQWNVILLNDDEHTFDYVIELLLKIFRYDLAKAIAVTQLIDLEGFAIVDTTSKERAELKQEQVHGMGPDFRMKNSQGPVTCVIEAAE